MDAIANECSIRKRVMGVARNGSWIVTGVVGDVWCEGYDNTS